MTYVCLSQNPVGSQVPQAAGIAYAFKLRKDTHSDRLSKSRRAARLMTPASYNSPRVKGREGRPSERRH